MNYRTKLILGLVIPDMVKKFKGRRPRQGTENQGFWTADVGSRRAGVRVGVHGCLARRRHLPDRHGPSHGRLRARRGLGPYGDRRAVWIVSKMGAIPKENEVAEIGGKE